MGPPARSQPVCAVTGNAREAQQNECLAAGFDDVRPPLSLFFPLPVALRSLDQELTLSSSCPMQVATKPYRLQDVLDKITRLTGAAALGPA